MNTISILMIGRTIAKMTRPKHVIYLQVIKWDYADLPSWRVITSTWWEGLLLPMIPRAMSAGAWAPGRATQAGKVKEEGRN
jgi:hypothetical protein